MAKGFPQGLCIWFASVLTAFGPCTDAFVSWSASRCAASSDLRGGPRIVKTRVRPEWLMPPWGTWISACQMGSALLSAGRSKTSAWWTSPVPSSELCGMRIDNFSDLERVRDRFREPERLREAERFLEADLFLDTERPPFFEADRLL